MKKIILSIVFLSFLVILYSCGDSFPYRDYLGYTKYHLIDQNGEEVVFPHDFEGNVVLMACVFTNCPDICPMTTHNLQLIQKRLTEEEIYGVKVVTISFDPRRDSPEVLKKYLKVREIDEENWSFLTGEKETVDSLIKELRFVAVSTDTTFTESGKEVYFFAHTDKIMLVDKKNQLRNEYQGSILKDENIIIEDVKRLTEE